MVLRFMNSKCKYCFQKILNSLLTNPFEFHRISALKVSEHASAILLCILLTSACVKVRSICL